MKHQKFKKNKIPFKITFKKKTRNKPKEVKDMYVKNNKTMIKETNDDSKK